MRAIVRIEPGTLYPNRKIVRMPDVYEGEVEVDAMGITLLHTQDSQVTLPWHRVQSWKRLLDEEDIRIAIRKAAEAAVVREPKKEAQEGFAELNAGESRTGQPAEIVASISTEVEHRMSFDSFNPEPLIKAEAEKRKRKR